MKILFICDEYPPGRHGGIGAMTQNLARAMVKAGQQVFVAGLYTPGYGQKDYEEDQGVRVWRRRMRLDMGLIGNGYAVKDIVLQKALLLSGLLPLDASRSLRRFNVFIASLISEHAIDIVEWPDYNDIFKYLRADFTWPRLPVPLVIKFHGTESFFRSQMGEKVDPRMLRLERRHIQRAGAFVAVSRDTAEHNRVLYGIEQEIGVLYNSIEIVPPAGGGMMSRPLRPTIVFTGSLTRKKGIFSLMRAWNIVHANHPEALLRIFGKGKPAFFQSLLNEAARSSVRFEGFAPRERLYPVLAGAAAAIFPSYVECFALAPLEAMAAGCPVIFTQRSSGPELIRHEIDGLLIDPDNEDQMAGSMIRLLENATLRGELSQNGRKRVMESFDIQQSVAGHLAYYERLIPAGRHG